MSSLEAIQIFVFTLDTKTSVVTGGIDGLIKIWKVDEKTFKETKVLVGHQMGVVSVNFNEEKTLIVSSALDGSLRVWDAVTGMHLVYIAVGTFDACSTVFSNDSKYLVIGGHHGKVRLFSIKSRMQTHTLHALGSFSTAVAASPDGKYIASADASGNLFLFDYVTGRMLMRKAAHLYSIRCLTFSPDSKIVITGSDDGQTHLYSTDKHMLINKTFGHTSTVLSCTFSKDGKFFVTGSVDQTVKVWDVFRFGTSITTFKGHTDQVRGACFLSSKKVVSVSDDKTLRMFRIKGEKKKSIFP